MVEELKKMFDFFYLRNGETKKEYKRRVEKRGTELLNGVNCSLEETINFIALCECKTHIFRSGSHHMYLILGDNEMELNDENEKDYEKFVFARFFDDLDKEKFEQRKKNAWDKIRVRLDKEDSKREQERHQAHFEECYREKLLDDDALIKEYGDLNADEQSRKINRKRFVPKK